MQLHIIAPSGSVEDRPERGKLTMSLSQCTCSEEREALAEFGNDYARYVRTVPGFTPRPGDFLGGPTHGRAGHGDGTAYGN